MRRSGVPGGLAVIVVCASIVLGATGASGTSGATCAASGALAPTFHRALNGVAASSACNVWVVGDGGLIEHWNGKAWKVQKIPNRHARFVSFVGVTTYAKNAWAVTSGNQIDHWNGRVWKVAHVAQPRCKRLLEAGGFANVDLNGVAATSSTNVWAVGSCMASAGSDRNSQTGVVEHWNGKAWKAQHSPNPGACRSLFHLCNGPYRDLVGVAAVSARDAWAVGSITSKLGRTRTVIEHWNGKAWRVQPSPSPGTCRSFGCKRLSGVAAVSAHDAWAVGQTSKGTLIERWNGKAWTVQNGPNVGKHSELSDVAAISARDAWAVGSTFKVNAKASHTLVEHWNGKTWNVQPSPNPGVYDGLSGVAATSPTHAWAVGFYGHTSAQRRSLVLRWIGTAWRVASQKCCK